MCWIMPPFCFLTTFSRFFSIFHCAIDFRTVSVVTFRIFLIGSLRSCWFAVVGLPPSYTKSCRISQKQESKELRSGEHDAHIHQQSWSLECSVVESVASLLRGVMEHCLAGIQSHCADKVEDIQAVRKFSIISVTVLVNFYFLHVDQ